MKKARRSFIVAIVAALSLLSLPGIFAIFGTTTVYSTESGGAKDPHEHDASGRTICWNITTTACG